MFLLINKTQAKCRSTHATSGTPYTAKVHTAGDVTLKQSDKPLFWKGGEGDDTCDAIESWILHKNIADQYSKDECPIAMYCEMI